MSEPQHAAPRPVSAIWTVGAFDEFDPSHTGVDHGQSLALLAQQTTILEMLASGAALADVLTAITLALESHMPGTRCSVLLFDKPAGRLWHGAAPSLPTAYIEAIQGLPVGPRSGSCGTAAYLGQQVVASDIGSDPRWADYRDLAAGHGLAACWSNPIHGQDGEVLGTFAVYHDVQHVPSRREARLVERYRHLAAIAISHSRLWGALAQSEEQFRRAFADNAIGMALLDLHGRFIRVNQAICDLLDRPEADLLGRHFVEVTHPEDAARSVASFAPLAAGEVVSGHQEKRYLRRDGSAVWVDMTASVVRAGDGSPLHISTNVQDLTARNAAEIERRARRDAELAAAAAETASRAKSEFLSTMSHELRTPLSAIVGFTELLQTLDLTGERRTTALEHIGRAARHIMAILDDVLDLAKIEAGAVTIEPSPVRVAPLVHQTVQLLEPLTGQRGLTVDTVHLDEQAVVLADPRRLRQVLLNVVSNAIKYNRADGEVEIRAVLADEQVLLSVRDTGEGIADELTARLFTPFDRLGAEAGSEPGAGLGLVVTERLVTAMGGSLHLHSRPGVGTTVTIALPVFTGAPTPARGRVLYVEDDAAHRLLVEEILRARPGIELITCTRGSEALALLHRDPPDLLLLDLDLPDMRGEQVLAAIPEDLMVCVLSGRLPADGLRDGTDRAGIPWLTKPLDGAVLLATLDDLLAT